MANKKVRKHVKPKKARRDYGTSDDYDNIRRLGIEITRLMEKFAGPSQASIYTPIGQAKWRVLEAIDHFEENTRRPTAEEDAVTKTAAGEGG